MMVTNTNLITISQKYLPHLRVRPDRIHGGQPRSVRIRPPHLHARSRPELLRQRLGSTYVVRQYMSRDRVHAPVNSLPVPVLRAPLHIPKITATRRSRARGYQRVDATTGNNSYMERPGVCARGRLGSTTECMLAQSQGEVPFRCLLAVAVSIWI